MSNSCCFPATLQNNALILCAVTLIFPASVYQSLSHSLTILIIIEIQSMIILCEISRNGIISVLSTQSHQKHTDCSDMAFDQESPMFNQLDWTNILTSQSTFLLLCIHILTHLCIDGNYCFAKLPSSQEHTGWDGLRCDHFILVHLSSSCDYCHCWFSTKPFNVSVFPHLVC